MEKKGLGDTVPVTESQDFARRAVPKIDQMMHSGLASGSEETVSS
jgi:hypothetical protein